MPEDQEILFELTDHIATITLNRPQKLNAVTSEMASIVNTYALEYNEDTNVRVVVITGSGEKAFCAGSDINDLDHYADPWVFRNRPDYCDAIRRLRKPTICAVNGFCLGGGLELAMSCDIRIASGKAFFGAPEIKLGWVGGGGMSYFLAHAIGSSNAALMLYTGDMIDAQQALNWRLVSEVVAPDKLLARTKEIACTIVQRAPIAAQTAKQNLRAAYSMNREDAIQYERDLQTICFATEDAAEGRQAFKDKRKANFRGR
ncbi:MAG: enoyl-CoA hydratase/isomerase family protein [Verrucomicrobia bacterium]|nr:enoyl-CoA hydratase/isomerase family protein [Verrucomicrobiota bacterium]MBV9300466.1 enoyl-CoA hydratase/isomerase family protein [Verrucomicrobiota bacterium]MBV9642535.1 enoyl-CoA hydratase/isomerase family protein [Verrucomicrobiota bacterium]